MLLARGTGMRSPGFSEAMLMRLSQELGRDPRAIEVAASDRSPDRFVGSEAGVCLTVAALYQCAIHIDAYDEDCWAALEVVPPESLQKAVKKRRAEFLAGRYCTRRALQAIGMDAATIERGEGGCPVWPQGVQGSISHHDGIVVAVTILEPGMLGVGVDVQSMVAGATIDEIGATILHGRDTALMAAHADRRELLFSLIFSAKESFFKAAFPTVKRYFGFEAAEIVELDLAAGSFVLRLRESLDDGLLLSGARFAGTFIVQGQHVITLLLRRSA